MKCACEIGATSTPPVKKRGRPPGTKAIAAKKKRVLSPEGRERIIAATKKRWAATRKAEKQAAKKRGGLTAAGRRRLSELMKARGASKYPPKAIAKKKL